MKHLLHVLRLGNSKNEYLDFFFSIGKISHNYHQVLHLFYCDNLMFDFRVIPLPKEYSVMGMIQ